MGEGDNGNSPPDSGQPPPPLLQTPHVWLPSSAAPGSATPLLPALIWVSRCIRDVWVCVSVLLPLWVLLTPKLLPPKSCFQGGKERESQGEKTDRQTQEQPGSREAIVP